MPAFERAELTAELKVVPSEEDSRVPLESARTTAGETGLAREAGPGSLVLAGGRREVLDAAMEVAEAALGAGARRVELTMEAEADRFDRA